MLRECPAFGGILLELCAIAHRNGEEKAGDGNRTRILSLENSYSTIELRPHSGQERVRTSVGRSPLDLQSSPVGRLGTCPKEKDIVRKQDHPIQVMKAMEHLSQ